MEIYSCFLLGLLEQKRFFAISVKFYRHKRLNFYGGMIPLQIIIENDAKVLGYGFTWDIIALNVILRSV